MTRLYFSIFCFFFLFSSFPLFAQATEETSTETVLSTFFDAETIVKGYTLSSDDGRMRLGIRPGTLAEATRVDIKTLAPSVMNGTYPTDATLLGNVYLFDITNKTSYTGEDFFFLEIKYLEEISYSSTLFGRRFLAFYNGVTEKWEELPSSDNPDKQLVQALIYLPYARLAVFQESVPEFGKASWYAYKECDCAASPDYAKGTYLVVSRTEDPTKAVTVRVNDYGPDRSVHPDRIIDLDRIAFQKLASLGAGVINVQVKFLQ